MGLILMIFRHWRPSLGVFRLAFFCGMLGAFTSTIYYWQPTWNWAVSVFWPHAYYEMLSHTAGAFPCNCGDDEAAIMLVRRSGSHRPPAGFTKASDLWGTPTADQWARSSPADPNQKGDAAASKPSSTLDDLLNEAQRSMVAPFGLLITEDGPGMPSFARLRTHPPGTEVYYAVLPKYYELDVPSSSYVRFSALLAVPGVGFLLPFFLIISVAWVVDGFMLQKRS